MSKNKIAKLLLALGIGVATVTSGVAIAGCNPGNGGGSTSGSEQSQKYTVTFDLNGGDGTAPSAKEVEEGGKVTAPTNPSRKGYTFDGWYTAATGGTIWSFSSDTVSEDITLYAHWTLKQQGSEETKLTSITATKTTTTYTLSGGSATIAVTDVTVTPNTGASLEGWTKVYVLEKDGTAVAGEAPWTVTEAGTYTLKVSVTKTGETAIAATPITITVSAAQGGDTQYEDVTTNFDFAAAQSYGTYTSDVTIGKFTFGVGGKFETNSGNNTWNSQGKDIKVVLAGTENSIAFNCQRASSKGTTNVSLLKVNEDTTTTAVTTGLKWKDDQGTEADGWAAAIVGKYYSYTATGLEKGTYIIRCNPSGRMTELSVTEKLPKGTPTNVTAENGIVDYLIGSHFDSTGMNFYLNYDNGRKDIISVTDIDSSALDSATAAGEYDINLSYTDGGQTYTGTVKAKLYAVEEIHLVTDKQEKNELQKTQQVYFVGDKFDDECYSVKIVGKLNEETHTFYNVDSSHYSATTPDMTEGIKEFKVTSTADSSKSDSFKYYVLPKLSSKKKEVMFVVDKAIPDASVGQESGGAYQFNGIQQAIDFIKLMNLDDGVNKIISIEPGTYEEKVEISDISNLFIFNENYKDGQDDSRVIIEYDAIHGNLDPSGTHTYESNDTATVSIRASAKNINLMNITINNKYRTAEQAEAHQSDDQALALITENDKTVLMNCELNGYQDTVQFKSGRALVVSGKITGSTDFIYGENSTVYFYQTEIQTIKSRDNGNGGYITAFKGTHSGDDTDAVKYGAIFDNCNFTYGEGVAHAESADDQVNKGLTAIARAWGDYAKIAVINSQLGGHISKEGYTEGTTKCQRYVAWKANENHPTDTTIEYVEYNNTGIGAITTAVNGMKMLTADEVKPYIYFSAFDLQSGPSINDKCEIFKKTNGKVTYEDDWDPYADLMAGEGYHVNYKLTVKNESGVEVGFIVIGEGEKLTAARLKAKVTVPDGKQIEGFYNEQACTTEYNFDEALSADGDIYVKFEEKTSITQSFNGATTGLQADADAKGKAYGASDSSTYPLFSVQFGTEGGNKLTALTHRATADDDSGLEFTQAFLPTGGGRTISVTAKADIWITVYYTVSDGSFQSQAGYAKTGNLKWTIGTGTAQTSAKTTDKANNVAYSEVIALKSGETIKLESTGNRFVLFGITATDVDPNA